MTDQRELQEAVKRLAKKAGVRVKKLGTTQMWMYYRPIWTGLPGENGTLEGEVEVVLSWLAKAGYPYTVLPSQTSEGLEVWIYDDYQQWEEEEIPRAAAADTLHAALAAAVIALPREGGGQR